MEIKTTRQIQNELKEFIETGFIQTADNIDNKEWIALDDIKKKIEDMRKRFPYEADVITSFFSK